ncbi:MAG: hypothetical protein AKCLJLPJ_01706 [Fimbriimonadales bacterium]|nr:MAG: hypothetical protein EDM73_11770 [Armatimonadota bacterium]MBV6503625.1 hypothetical protein [Fimbriimonadales bacterium]MCE7900658.1 hypothetical protein [Armatimonadetes bacterium ATM1]MDL1928538.1 hypothetical protein [Fimbriimonadia bacterium ATM]MBC6970019.1 hypothetical protein [Armatimonadota bacterium]
MFGLLFYAAACLFVAFLLVGVTRMFTKVSKIGDNPIALKLAITWVVLLAIPYIWVEVQTAMHRKDFETVIAELADAGSLSGEPTFFRVQYEFGDRASLVVVSEVTEDWGGTARNIYRVVVQKEDGEWSNAEVIPVRTDSGEADGFTVPPYW